MDTATGIKKPYILMIEDDDFLTRMYEMKFSALGIGLKVISDGKKAMNLLRDETVEPPSLILLDLMLPFASGFQILDKIKKTPGWEQVPVIVVSNLGQDADIQKALRLGAKEYFIKGNTALSEMIERILKYINPVTK
ncbi:MAG: hypothetical protein A3J67_03665 [Parcubacteria group bacterium RIFCSPHIGHO2_02_FULL_48_10b]|nr:MAG: hypothetical protein A3J67_03665 [Parcubacteria group bacterium RIFCSPHIGHO2_02_FULL_48_10b]